MMIVSYTIALEHVNHVMQNKNNNNIMALTVRVLGFAEKDGLGMMVMILFFVEYNKHLYARSKLKLEILFHFSPLNTELK